MAIRKDIDDMLNNLKSGKPLESPKKPDTDKNVKHAVSKIDNMSVDDLLSSIKVTDSAPEKQADTDIQQENYNVKSSNESTIENQRIEAEQAERERIKAEREAEIVRIKEQKAQQKRLEEERIAAERAEQERIEAERIAAERAEQERIKAERIAAERAEQERIEAERIAAERAEQERIEAERIAAEKAEQERIKAELDKNKDSENETVAALSSAKIDDAEPDEEDISNEENAPEKKKFSLFKKKNQLSDSDDIIDEDTENYDNESEKKSGGVTSTLKNILDEDPDEIIARRSEQIEADDEPTPKGRFKKGFYAVFGVIFSVLACIGLVTVIAKSIDKIGSYTSGDSRKEGFEQVLYPAVIMDIETFNSPAELPSEQIITAAIWSMIMTDGVTDQYELTFDVVIIPAADVESYAVKLFGENIPQLNHTTVGPSESRFYYNEETKSYNVPVAPVTYTYSPEIREATKTGNEYTVKVDYIDELPSWLPKTSSKSVEFVLTENNGTYQLKSMKILSTNTNAV